MTERTYPWHYVAAYSRKTSHHAKTWVNDISIDFMRETMKNVMFYIFIRLSTKYSSLCNCQPHLSRIFITLITIVDKA
jgi:hypothetical protein